MPFLTARSRCVTAHTSLLSKLSLLALLMAGSLWAMPVWATVTISGDPTTCNVAGSDFSGTDCVVSATDIQTALGDGAVSVTSTSGDIVVSAEVTWASVNALTLEAHANITIDSSITASNATGRLVLEYGQGAVEAGNTATYTINVPISLQARGAANGANGATLTNFSTKLGSDGTVQNFTTISTRVALANIETATAPSASSRYALGGDIDLEASPWTPLGLTSTYFGGVFDGLGNTVRNLSHTGVDYLGLFRTSNQTAKFSNLKLENFTITTTATPDLSARVGGLVGHAIGGLFYNISLKDINISGTTGTHANYTGAGSSHMGGLIGLIATNSSSISRIRGESISISGVAQLGGLFGSTNIGGHIISDVQLNNVSFTITGYDGAGSRIGGLIGSMFTGNVSTLISQSSVTNLSVTTKDNDNLSDGIIGGIIGRYTGGQGIIRRSYATGTIVANNYTGTNYLGHTAYGLIGGLAGQFRGSIENSYSTVDITLNGNNSRTNGVGVGGLVGRTEDTSSITNSYSAGLVSSGNLTGTSLNTIGGFLGRNNTTSGLTLSGNFWDTNTSTRDNAIGTSTLALAVDSALPEGKITADMQKIATFTGATWDIDTDYSKIWNIADGSSYPCLTGIGACVTIVPGAPTAATATAGNAQAAIIWTAPASNGGSAITGYTVTANSGATCTTATTSCTVTGLTNGTAYTFTVVATNAVGDSVSSAPSNSVTPATVPDAPAASTATAGNTQATISWTAPASDGGSAITGYTVTASPDGSSCTTATTSCAVTGLSNGTAYTFTVVASNAVGNSAASTASNSVTPTAPEPEPESTPAPEGDVVYDNTTTCDGSIASGCSELIEDGFTTVSYQSTEGDIEVTVTSNYPNPPVTHTLTTTDGEGRTVTTRATITLPGATTRIGQDSDGNLQVISHAVRDGVTYEVIAKADGSAEHKVRIADGTETVAISTVPGAFTEIKETDGRVEVQTHVELEKVLLDGVFHVTRAVVITREDGEGYTRFDIWDAQSETWQAQSRTARGDFEAGHTVVVELDEQGDLQLRIRTTLTRELQF